MGAGGSIPFRGTRPTGVGVKEIDFDTAQFILNDDVALQFFAKFCNSDEAKDEQFPFSLLDTYQAISNMTEEYVSGKAINFVLPPPDQAAPFTDFLKTHMMQEYIVREVDKQDPDLELGDCLTRIHKDIVGIMVVRYFPRFLKSKHYSDYCNAVNNSVKTSENGTSIRSISSFREENSANLRLTQALSLMQHSDVDNLIQADYWLRPLFACCDNLPVCICVSTASKDRFGFPVIYVNKEFERVTQFTSKDIVGKSCSVLQDEYDLRNSVSEQDQIALLSNALRHATPVNCALSNKRKDGSVFKNLLSMKPIFDQEGNYRYVLSVQFDILDSRATQKKLKVAQNILALMPDVLYVNEDDKTFKPSRALTGLAVEGALGAVVESKEDSEYALDTLNEESTM
jgi:PAS domain S-box-containing protein